LAQEPTGAPEQRVAHKKFKASHVALKLLVVVAACAGAYFLFLRETSAIRVGEELTYGVYLGENKVGVQVMRVNKLEEFQGARCYEATYALTVGRVAQVGQIIFDERGRLRSTSVAKGYLSELGELENVEWATKITCFLDLNKMNVKITYPDKVEEEDLSLPPALATAEQLRYALRIERLRLGYYKEFNLSYFPNARVTGALALKVTGEEELETPAGSFECWVVEGSGAFAMRMWVAKDGRAVPLVHETTAGGVTWRYVLEEIR